MTNPSEEPASDLLRKKQLANAYLPRLAEGLVRGEIDIASLCRYFRNVAHLYTVGIDVNAICNLHCGYCYLDKYNRQTAPVYVNLDSLYRFLEEVIDTGVDLIAIVGKEPFADQRGMAVLQRLHAYRLAGKRFRYGVVTNGTLLAPYLDSLPSTISYIDVSLDGSEDKTDRMRGPGVYRKATAAVQALVERGFDVWVSSVMYTETMDAAHTAKFMSAVAEQTGCGKFYFSPVRNFTGSLEQVLISYTNINQAQLDIVQSVESEQIIEKVILDHPYEAVWRDYFIPLASGSPSRLDRLSTDAYGNVLDPLSARCFRKLDVFPHGPWGTCRIDARGEYLPDVESRALAFPKGMGNIATNTAMRLHEFAMKAALEPMLIQFLANMNRACFHKESDLALQTRSVPGWTGQSRFQRHNLGGEIR